MKTGGLGDVMYALPKALIGQNCDVRVIIPRYQCIPQKYQEKMGRLARGHQICAETKVVMNPELREYLDEEGYSDNAGGTVAELIKRPGIEMAKIASILGLDIDEESCRQLDIEIKYEGYISKARREADNMVKMEEIRIPEGIDFNAMDHLSLEARQKLSKVRPLTIGQASRISGVNPADIMVLMIYLKQNQQV